MKNLTDVFEAKDITYALIAGVLVYILVKFLWDGSVEVSDSLSLIVFIVTFVAVTFFLRRKRW